MGMLIIQFKIFIIFLKKTEMIGIKSWSENLIFVIFYQKVLQLNNTQKNEYYLAIIKISEKR